MVKALFIKYETFIKFCLIGAMNAVLSILIYNVLMRVGLHYIAAYIIAYLLTWCNAFYWNGKHVFKAASRKTMVKYFVLYLFSFAVGNGLLFVQVDMLQFNETLAQLPVIAVGTVINYTGSKYWAFKQPT